ncbi:P-loop containing nucleoside triphosphate hydrolase protein [Neohortaea acidophila]|uniref:P-loop containing nucleoside triphosphate hydrolase protein n=1 Tax=Neohortaea acidophila TaxID=245834 RepID=A0A6A6PHJ7_9PEZI|nr:P-loop containing nucleoside triphosphate hydrolase protein [Neohortaea acidophila]KAF2479498.1 P-loop containing nucleoside triphosphate hydrolase protein [Neohortaea acidophila]
MHAPPTPKLDTDGERASQGANNAMAGKSSYIRDPFNSLSGLKPAPKLNSKSLKSIKAMASKPVAEPAVYKRVDQLWDSTIHNYKLKESAEEDDSEFAEFAFLVRRTFDWENKYRDTVVDIKSKLLRAALVDVMKDCKSVALEVAEPTLDPNLLFLYLEELRTYYKTTLKAKIKAEKKKKVIKKLEQQRKIVKVLVQYLDVDYEDTKKTLYPLLEAGNITFDLLWALFKPNEIAVTSCYGIWSEPRCFKVEYANKCASLTRGEWYCIEGRYLEYDGKSFGFGDFESDVEGFKGPRKITTLSTYPLQYHQDPEKVKQQILERSEKFLNLEGMHYKFHKGLAFMKKKKQVLKININSRIMLDPATFRRVNPNYPISWIKPKEDADLFSLSDDDSDGGCSCGGDSDDDVAGGADHELSTGEDRSPKYKYKWTKDDKGRTVGVRVEVDDDGNPVQSQRVEKVSETPDGRRKIFTEEELLLTSPVMLGFAFSEKLWLEFSISGVRDIVYNEDAFESLVLPPNQKSIVKAQVESHKFHGAKTIDDVVQGKGKGLVAVLHGPPGTGKTLTAEGIAELLKCPLYMVSAGELGTDSSKLEFELQKILDIAHSWGAVLLLDEADVFLEKREVHDIHRNALVSIFLRLLEYFQGILFLTTNRVETFDDAFQSRIHIALRYNELNQKARKAVWKMFLDKVKDMEGLDAVAFSDSELDILSRNQLNGRQIKNLVRTAQALALNEKEKLTMEHIKRVIEVAESFGHDLRGGTGYIDAMRSYT